MKDAVLLFEANYLQVRDRSLKPANDAFNELQGAIDDLECFVIDGNGLTASEATNLHDRFKKYEDLNIIAMNFEDCLDEYIRCLLKTVQKYKPVSNRLNFG